MTHGEYHAIEAHMLHLMRDSAHDRHHIYRVLYTALDIAGHEERVDTDILLAACLLHDIGREQQFENLELDHAQIGGEMACRFLLERGWPGARARQVQACIAAHRYRGDNAPESLEAKILFDADKLDVSGAIGIARTLVYEGTVGEPLYILDESGAITEEGGGAEVSSFFQEYTYKLKKVYGAFHTRRAAEIAAGRQKTAEAFYRGLHGEITQVYALGQGLLDGALGG